MHELKSIAVYPDNIAANLDRKKLEDAGINAEVFNHHDAGLSNATLMVNATDEERATIFLNSYKPEKPTPKKISANAIRCPECNSKKITRKPGFWSRFSDYMMFDVLAFFINSKKDKHTCHDCGHCWRIWFNR